MILGACSTVPAPNVGDTPALTGRVVDEAKRPIADAEVGLLFPDEQARFTTTAQSDGTFQFKAKALSNMRAQSRYFLYARSDDGKRVVQKGRWEVGGSVSLTASLPKENRLEPQGYIYCYVGIWRGGEPVSFNAGTDVAIRVSNPNPVPIYVKVSDVGTGLNNNPDAFLWPGNSEVLLYGGLVDPSQLKRWYFDVSIMSLVTPVGGFSVMVNYQIYSNRCS